MTSHHAPTPKELEVPITAGQVKRVLEWYCSSEKFRKLIEVDPEAAGEQYNLGFNPQIIRAAWDAFYAIDAAENDHPVHPAVKEYNDFYLTKAQWRDQVKEESTSDNPQFKAWRERQIARNCLENGAFDDHIIHAPFAIELADGCSVGCWFCGVGATKLATHWRYTPENEKIWKQVVTVLRDKVGAGSKWGFCYWATDPMDNPDYEKFASDFSDIVGMFPQTTTALGHKYPERIRKLLKESEAKGCLINRFSVVTERFLKQIHASYTADELLRVEIVAQMPEGTTPKAAAGAFMERAKNNDKLMAKEQAKITAVHERNLKLAEKTSGKTPEELAELASVMSSEQPGTIACVSGFLLNMVTRKIKLISPCRASEKWPLGYIVFDERTFTDAADLNRIVEEMIEEHMSLEIEPTDKVSLAHGLQYERVEDGFHIASPMSALSFLRPDMPEYVGSIGDQVSSGKRTAGQIAMSAFFEHGVPEVNTLNTLGMLFQRGLLVGTKEATHIAMHPAE